MAVIQAGSLTVLALDDCHTLLQLEWPFAADQDWGDSARFSIVWSPDSQALYLESAPPSEHHICSLRPRWCWLDLR